MNLYIGMKKSPMRGIRMLRASLFAFFTVLGLCLTGCGGGGGHGSTSGPSGVKPDNLPIESIVVVSPTESGGIDLVTGYPQKILVAGIDKNGTRKLLGAKDGLTFALQLPNLATITESGMIAGNSNAVGESTLLNIKFSNNVFLNIPVSITAARLESIVIYTHESSISPIPLPEDFHVKLNAQGSFDDNKTRDISTYAGLWSSNDSEIAFESDTIFGPSLFGNSAGVTTINAFGGINVESSIDVHVYAAQLESINLTPNNNIIPFESKISMKAIGTFLYGSGGRFDTEITDNLVWSAESKALASIDDTTGVLTSKDSAGKVIVHAVLSKLAKSTIANLTIGDAVIESVFISTEQSGSIETSSINIEQAGSINLYPFGIYSDGKTYRLDKSVNPECSWLIGDTQNPLITLLDHDSYTTLTAEKVGSTSVIFWCSDSLNYTTKISIVSN